MKQATDEQLLAFLEGSMGETERIELLDALDHDPELAERLRAAAAGLEAVRGHQAAAGRGAAPHNDSPGRALSPWWPVLAAAATLIVAVPATWWAARAALEPGAGEAIAGGMPSASEPSFVLVLHGRWPDAGSVDAVETQRRAREYWDWTSSLAADGTLVAAGDLRWEPGERLGPTGVQLQVVADELERPEYMVGMFALRVDSYEDALELASQCPHLRYGGTVSVRRVGSGFVTVPGMGDW